MSIVIHIAVSLLILNLCWLCLHLLRRVRSLEMRADDHEQRIGGRVCVLTSESQLRREFDADYQD